MRSGQPKVFENHWFLADHYRKAPQLTGSEKLSALSRRRVYHGKVQRCHRRSDGSLHQQNGRDAAVPRLDRWQGSDRVADHRHPVLHRRGLQPVVSRDDLGWEV